MKNPKITISSRETHILNPDFGREAYVELKKIKSEGTVQEYGCNIILPSSYKTVKPEDIIMLTYPEVDILCEVRIVATYESGKQSVCLKYKDFIFKEN